MATSGSLMPRPTRIGGRTRMATGPTPMSAGLGCRMRISAGPPITTVAGSDWKTMAGAGFPAMNGDRPGSPGGPAEIILAGLRYRRQDGGEIVYESRPIGGHVDVDFGIGPAYYNFIDIRFIGEPVLRGHYYPYTQNVVYINNTVNVTNITYNNSIVYNYGRTTRSLSRYSTRPIQRLKLERDQHRSITSGQGWECNQGSRRQAGTGGAVEVQKPNTQIAPKAVKAKIDSAQDRKRLGEYLRSRNQGETGTKVKDRKSEKRSAPDVINRTLPSKRKRPGFARCFAFRKGQGQTKGPGVSKSG